MGALVGDLPSKRDSGSTFFGFAGYNFAFGDVILGLEADYTRSGHQYLVGDYIARRFTTSDGTINDYSLTTQQGAELLVRHVLASEAEHTAAERKLASWLVVLSPPMPRWELVTGEVGGWLTKSLVSHESHLLIIGGAHHAPHPLLPTSPLARLLHEPGDVMVLR